MTSKYDIARGADTGLIWMGRIVPRLVFFCCVGIAMVAAIESAGMPVPAFKYLAKQLLPMFTIYMCFSLLAIFALGAAYKILLMIGLRDPNYVNRNDEAARATAISIVACASLVSIVLSLM